MKKLGLNKITFFIIFLFTLVYLIIYLITNLVYDYSEQHTFFLLAILIIINFSLLVVALNEKNYFLFSGSILLSVSSAYEFFMDVILAESIDDYIILDGIYHITASVGLALVVVGIYLVDKQKRKQEQINVLANELNESVYIELLPKTQELSIEFSEQFMKKYGLRESQILLTVDEYKTLIHPRDVKVNCFHVDSKYRIKFAGMTVYASIMIKGNIEIGDRIVYMGFDISRSENIQKQYHLLEREHNKVLSVGTDFVAKFDKEGYFLDISQSYASLYKLQPHEMIGRHLYEFDQQNQWFQDTLQVKSDTSEIKNMSRDEELWISWSNSVILNDTGEVEYVISIGRDITDLIVLNKNLEHQSNHDFTTGLLNAKALTNELMKAHINNAV